MFNFAVIFLTQSTMLTRTATRGSAAALPDACWHPVLLLPRFKKRGGPSWLKSSWPSQESSIKVRRRTAEVEKKNTRSVSGSTKA